MIALDDAQAITERARKAVEYLSQTDVSHAQAKAELEALKELTKTVHAYEFIDAEGAMDLRKATAFASDSYREHIEKVKAATEAFQTLHNKRTNAALSVELYRTMSANRRTGNI